MSLNKSKGNMYPWVDYTWNPIRGKCPHDCVYCFMKGRDVGPLRLDEKTLADNLGSGRTIFVGSSTDMFAMAVPHTLIFRVLEKCNKHQNTYIFQSKDPGRFCYSMDMLGKLPPQTILGTTLETNRDAGQEHCGFAPPPWARTRAMKHASLGRFKKMVSIEPIMAFDFDIFLKWIRDIKPAFVSIGADSKGHNLPEPQQGDIDKLVIALREFTEVKLKKNLARILLGGKKIKTRR